MDCIMHRRIARHCTGMYRLCSCHFLPVGPSRSPEASRCQAPRPAATPPGPDWKNKMRKSPAALTDCASVVAHLTDVHATFPASIEHSVPHGNTFLCDIS